MRESKKNRIYFGFFGIVAFLFCMIGIKLGFAEKKVTVSYRTHVQSVGWQGWVKDGKASGTFGRSLRLEGIQIKVSGNSNLGIAYTTHVQTYGWLPWSASGEMSGTTGESKRLEAIKIRLTGSDADKYDVYYRVHAQRFGWMGWAKNGQAAGSAGYSFRLEAIQIMVVEKGTAINANYDGVRSATTTPYAAVNGAKDANVPITNGPVVMYKTHVQKDGWQNWVTNGKMSGTSGRSLRLEGINIRLCNKPYSGGITYRTHVQQDGWQGWVSDGAMSGTSGRSLRLEGIQIKLTGEMAKYYDVYYTTHVQSIGWQTWKKNGEMAGTSGLGLRLEGIQIKLVKKGGKKPTEHEGASDDTTEKPSTTEEETTSEDIQKNCEHAYVYTGESEFVEHHDKEYAYYDVSYPDDEDVYDIDFNGATGKIKVNNGWELVVDLPRNGASDHPYGKVYKTELGSNKIEILSTGNGKTYYEIGCTDTMFNTDATWYIKAGYSQNACNVYGCPHRGNWHGKYGEPIGYGLDEMYEEQAADGHPTGNSTSQTAYKYIPIPTTVRKIRQVDTPSYDYVIKTYKCSKCGKIKRKGDYENIDYGDGKFHLCDE